MVSSSIRDRDPLFNFPDFVQLPISLTFLSQLYKVTIQVLAY